VDSYTGGRGESGEGIAFLGLVLVALALLVIACANVANLLLVRASERIKNLGVQSALGAGRIHLSAQLFFEALILALVGGAGGLFLAWMGVEAIQRSLAAEHFGYFWMRMAVDGRVMAFSFLLMGGIAVFAGTLPILRVLRTDLQGVLKEGPGEDHMSGGGSWSRWFVTVQLGLSCAALVAAGLTGMSLARSSDFGRGVSASEVLVASLDPLGVADPSAPGWAARIGTLIDALGSVGGAESAALAMGAPGYFEPRGRFELEGDEAQRVLDRRGVGWNAVSPGYFSLFDLEIVQGRGLQASDAGNDQPVAVVNQAFASNNLPDGESIGKRLRIFEADTAAFFTVVGVVENVDMGAGPSLPEERVYLSLLQVPQPTVLALVRSPAGGATLSSALRSTLTGVDPEIPVWSIRTLSDAHDFMIRIPRAMASIALAGGLGGLLVAAVGLYALLAFRVRQRRRELGVRLALGADGRVLAGEVIRLALRQLIPAVVFGLAVAWLLAPILGAVVLSSNPRSPGAFLGVAVSFVSVGLVAALLPARRAAAVDPAQVLRGE
jgi:predicted permease